MRQSLQLLLASLLVLIGGYVAYVLIFAPSQVPGLRVVDLSGQVQREDGDGRLFDAEIGDSVRPRDTLSVKGEGQAVLAVGEGTRLTLEAQSSLRVLEVDEHGVRVELQDGRVSARVRPGGAVDINSRGRSLSATDADFTVTASEGGGVAVDTTRGAVKLRGFDDLSSSSAGQRVRSLPDRPTVAGNIPLELLLEVAWPAADAPTHESEAVLQGRTDPYAEVRVKREAELSLLRAGPDGRFSTTVALQEGVNHLQVRAKDLTGTEVESTGAILREQPPPPVTSVEVQWGG